LPFSYMVQISDFPSCWSMCQEQLLLLLAII
jgi:hypothetical protein